MAKQTIMKKKISIFLQAKGGVGKSWLSFFKTLSEQSQDANLAAVLLDSSQKANQNAMRFIKALGENNVFIVDIYNKNAEYKKSHFFNVFEFIAKQPQQHIILDMGAPESNVFREAIQTDLELTPENIKFLCDDLNLDMKFNVVVSGADDNVNENIDYFNALNKAFKDILPVNCLLNDYTFKAEGESDILSAKLIDNNLASLENIKIVGKSGNRNNDNPYYDIIAVANAEKTLDEANTSMATKIRLRNIMNSLVEI